MEPDDPANGFDTNRVLAYTVNHQIASLSANLHHRSSASALAGNTQEEGFGDYQNATGGGCSE
jgi:hypothetical protein